MTKKTFSYEAGKLLFVLWCAASIAFIAFALYQFLSGLLQLGFSLIPGDLWHTMVDEPSSSKVQPILDMLKGLNKELTTKDAVGKLILWGILAAAGAVSFVVARDQLVRHERRFRRAYMPEILAEHFTDAVYSPKKQRSDDEPLCRIGLLRNYERYYTANRLEALYRDCWVASEEVICGGVYGTNYTSHKVKVRGQWMTVRLSQTLGSPVIIEAKQSKNRLLHSRIAATMSEINFSYDAFANAFRCFAESPELAQQLITRPIADRLLKMLETYEDFCVIFDGCNMHVLLRRKSFDRRLECLRPYTLNLLRREELRLYQPLRDFTDMLLE